MKFHSFIFFALATSTAAGAGVAAPGFKTVCFGARHLCVQVPSAWSGAALRTQSAGGTDKIVAVYKVHAAGQDVGFPEGFTATARSVGPKLNLAAVYADTADELESLSSDITYRRLTSDWFVLSGHDAKGYIFYLKGVAGSGIYKELNVYYPPGNAAYWSPLLGPMGKTFR